VNKDFHYHSTTELFQKLKEKLNSYRNYSL